MSDRKPPLISDRTPPAPQQQKSKPNRLKWFCGGLVAASLLVFFLPAILVNTPLKQWAIDYVLADLNGSASVTRISAGWFSPIQLEDVVLRDEGGQELIAVESIRTSLSLFGFMFASNYGTVEVVNPGIDLIVRESGSNLEDVFAAYMAPSDSDTPTALPRVSLAVTGGLVRLRSETLNETHVFENIDCSAETLADVAPLILQLNCAGRSGSSAGLEPAGRLAVNVQIDVGQSQISGNNIAAAVHAEKFPLTILAPILTRLIGPVNCGGQLDSDFQVAINLLQSAAQVEVQNFQAVQFAFVAPALLGSDQFSATSLTATGTLNLSPSLITANQFRVESEFMQLSVDGRFDVKQLANLANGGDLPQSGFQLDATVDLAQLANMLPETSRLREEVRLNSGLIRLQAATRVENGAARLIVNADAANMNFVVNGQNIQWQNPVRFVGVAGRRNGAMQLDSLELQSDFLTVTGDATIDRGQVRIEADLNKAVQQIGQVFDLSGLQVAGQMQGSLRWQAVNDPTASPAMAAGRLPISIDCQLNVTNPAFQYPGYQLWQHREMSLALTSAAAVDHQGQLAVQTADVRVVIGNEQIVAVLNEPIDDLAQCRKFQFQCDASGSIAKWLEHARVFSEFPEFLADGALSSQFVLTLHGQSCRLNKLNLTATDFSFDGFSMSIREPSLAGKMNFKYHYADGSVEFSKATLTSASIAASTDQLKLQTAEKLLIDGEVAFRANANRASNWFGYSMPGDSVRWDGSAIGQMRFSSESRMLGGLANVEIADLVVVQPSSPSAPVGGNLQQVSQTQNYVEVWREPLVVMSSDIQLTDDLNNLRMRSLDLKSKLADVQAKGSINDLGQSVVAALTGRWDVKWENVNQIVRDMAGDVIVFEGNSWQPFEFKGPLCEPSNSINVSPWISSALGGSASIAWSKASVFSLPLGPSQIDIGIAQSVAQLTTPGTAAAPQSLVKQLMTLQPILDLRQADPFLRMGQGKLLDQWRISAADSRTWLKYAAPLVADATSAEGQVSVLLDGANINLFDPMNASAKGTIEVHQLTIGAGPLAQQLLPMIDQVRTILKPSSTALQQNSTWLQLKPQTLPVTVDRGRVYHDGFEMNYKEFAIRTRGSVGFDQSLNMVADIPILDEWIARDKVLASLKGKSISIPITGTLSKPKLDSSVVSQMTAQLLRDSAMGAVNDKVTREVDKLQQKVGESVQDELDKVQNKVNDKIKNEVEDRLKGELENGLRGLFGSDKKK